jgi:hypothetical protein
MTTYRIKDWHETFENHDSRKIKGALKWVQFPCRQDSTAFVKLSRTVPGTGAIGMFGVLVQLAARCPERGVLADDKGPWTPERYADRFGLHDDSDSPEAQQYLAFAKDSWARLVRCGWLVSEEEKREMPGDAGRSREMPGDLPDTNKQTNKQDQQQQQSENPVVVVVENSLLRKALADVGIVGKTLDELAKTAIAPSAVRAEASKIAANKGGTGALVNRLRELAANPAQPRPVTAPRPREVAPETPVDPEAEKQALRARLETTQGTTARRIIEKRLAELEGAA